MKRILPHFLTMILILTVIISGCGGGNSGGGNNTPPSDSSPKTALIDLSHNGTLGSGFGYGPDTNLEAKRWQTFFATTYPVLSAVEVKIRKLGSVLFSPVRIELYEVTEAGLPTGDPLACGFVSPDLINTDFTVVKSSLSYNNLIAGKEYAIVLTQETLTAAHYEWCDRVKVDPKLHFGKYTVAYGWSDESDKGDGWLKVHVASTPTKPRILFSDDFERTELGTDWTIVQPKFGEWRIIQDSGIGSRVLETTDRGRLVAGESTWTNYTALVRIRPKASTSTIALMLRYQDQDNYYYVELLGGNIHLGKRSPGDSFTRLKSSIFSYDFEHYYRIRVQVNGPLIAVYVGDEATPRFTYTDKVNPLTSGKIGLVCDYFQGGYFDDVQVETVND